MNEGVGRTLPVSFRMIEANRGTLFRGGERFVSALSAQREFMIGKSRLAMRTGRREPLSQGGRLSKGHQMIFRFQIHSTADDETQTRTWPFSRFLCNLAWVDDTNPNVAGHPTLAVNLSNKGDEESRQTQYVG